MSVKWNAPAAAGRLLEEPKIVLAAPGSVSGRHRLTQVLAAGSLLAVGLRPLPAAALAPATSYLVTNLNPSGSGSLRDAIGLANAHPGADMVTFQTGLTGTIPLNGQIIISDTVQIIGPGPGALAVSGSNAGRIFYLYTASVITTTISGLTLRDGSELRGGAISDQGQPLTLDNVHLVSNTASLLGGAVYLAPGTANHSGLSLRNSLVTGNHADTSGGGLFLYKTTGGVQISNTQFVSNTAGNGGAVVLQKIASPTLIEASGFLSNTAGDAGGAINSYYTGVLTIENTLISGNISNGKGAGLFLEYLGATTIQSSTIALNQAHDYGGGLTVVSATGQLKLANLNILTNTADGGDGGGIYLKQIDGPSAIQRTTISGNTAHVGAGIYFYSTDVPTVIENSTISTNHATRNSGGVSLYNGSFAVIYNSTIVSNTSPRTGGGVEVFQGTVAVRNSIIAGNVAPFGPDISGTLALQYDLIQVTGTATIVDYGGNLFGLDPLLGPLANNGGPTQTHLPLHGSPVIDTGDPAFAPPPSIDQRGQPRVAHGRIDMGAVETAAEVLQLFLPLVRR